ncbi:MAG TPA: L,D-transpeptidase [Ktedonobacterales bacterium]|nr:L,D-transpeptidase [Ktedonobacterales bacterium]
MFGRQSVNILPRRTPRWVMALLIVVVVCMTLAACGSDPNQEAAQQNKARLDNELKHARTALGLPDSMLNPIVTQENQISSGEGGFNYNYQDAAANYTLLFNQLVSMEQNAQQTLQKQANDDIQAFAKAVTQLRGDGFSEIDVYQARLDQAVQDWNTAKTVGDYARVDITVQQQTAALHALWPAYQKLQDFQAILRTLQNAGMNSAMGQIEYQQNLDAIRAGLPADRYSKLVAVIDGQIVQLMADQAEATPYIGAALLDSFQARIDLLKTYGQNTTTFQQQHDDDVTQLKAAKSTTDYLQLGQTVNKQIDAMSLSLLKAKAFSDYAQLQKLVNLVGNIRLTCHLDNCTYPNGDYPADYEYLDPWVGIGDAHDVLYAARDLGSYQAADDVIINLTISLRALKDNLNDPTPHSQPHATDLLLINTAYHLTGKVIVVSLREQTLRAYDNGQMVWWSYVTTGAYRPNEQLPSWPGLHYAMYKLYHTEFTSPDPPGSPDYYAPTPINYAIAYAPNGYFLHDAWWRAEFGPDTNLPHWDPAAFSGGSHGCVNLPENNMAYLYDWTPIGTPIVVY